MLPNLQNIAQIHFSSLDTFPQPLRKNHVLPFLKDVVHTKHSWPRSLWIGLSFRCDRKSLEGRINSNTFKGNCLNASAPEILLQYEKYKNIMNI